MQRILRVFLSVFSVAAGVAPPAAIPPPVRPAVWASAGVASQLQGAYTQLALAPMPGASAAAPLAPRIRGQPPVLLARAGPDENKLTHALESTLQALPQATPKADVWSLQEHQSSSTWKLGFPQMQLVHGVTTSTSSFTAWLCLLLATMSVMVGLQWWWRRPPAANAKRASVTEMTLLDAELGMDSSIANALTAAAQPKYAMAAFAGECGKETTAGFWDPLGLGHPSDTRGAKVGRRFFNFGAAEEAPPAKSSENNSKPRASTSRSAGVLKLAQLGGSPSEKALHVNLDPTIYGSFAEIGAGQEVSRNFLTAGAAAGTVARSLSAYDMQMSDVTYGKAKRYVTKERLLQMLNTEFETMEESIRETKGPDTRFFAFASTLAAKAFNSDRECEGWVGLTFQAHAGEERSTVVLHTRMTDSTAQEQGKAIGVLGTNLLYLCNSVLDPYLITSFLLDGLEQGRLEIDFIDFSGPAFPEDVVDCRLLAMRMVQFRIAKSVLLEYNPDSGRYQQSVPNNALYKRPVVVERSRFRPVTYSHKEIIDSATRQLESDLGSDSKTPMKIFNMQIDDMLKPPEQLRTEERMKQTQKIIAADTDGDGQLKFDELRAIVKADIAEELDEVLEQLDIDNRGEVAIDALTGLSRDSIVVTEFLDRFNMLEALEYPVLVSGISRTHSLAKYFSRYTKEQIIVAIGGGNYSIQRGLFNPESYSADRGGMLEGFGRLFAGKVRIFQYPNISMEGVQTTSVISDDSALSFLYQYLVKEGKIVPITSEYIIPEALNADTNTPYRGQSENVIDLIKKGADWEKYVPNEVAAILKKRTWFRRLSTGKGQAKLTYKLLSLL